MRTLLVSACSLLSCATSPRSVELALAAYAHHLEAMDTHALASTYTDDGEAVTTGGPTHHGPADIEAFLRQFQDYHVLRDELVPAHTQVDGPRAHQDGTYFQRVTLPDGRTVEARGQFTADWRRVDGTWKLARLVTTPAP